MSRSPAGSFAGDVSPTEAWDGLSSEPQAMLIDVRTRAEWGYVGIVDLSAIGKETLLVEWQSYPAMEVNADFADVLSAELERRGIGRETALYFICRSGARSLAAARAVAAAGFDRCFNIAGGFEGPLDDARHRGLVDGWKAAGLPWVQS
ncbi:rhodanese-like domain-containing protein [Kaistia dalseonensis]|uniref:Rhodanese-related sulfurtransferase n=1 Tax=Kaistia dalseonensis TaxID=410840 RepID=A0ABU0H5H0_9HYPH|nr:rhodanese-like domain-containing protein [Kaistia dalseonensis]MCX5494976.1 rhodanese-like domain-containing protein [Kaistia dalseonensis]MDQ0437557.1 rhodanese-related sulfurtransferase [Kaistia dalseonensis]